MDAKRRGEGEKGGRGEGKEKGNVMEVGRCSSYLRMSLSLMIISRSLL